MIKFQFYLFMLTIHVQSKTIKFLYAVGIQTKTELTTNNLPVRQSSKVTTKSGDHFYTKTAFLNINKI